MLTKRGLIAFCLCASSALAAEPPLLSPLKGDKLKGDLVSLNDKEIVLKVDGKDVATPVIQTLSLDFGPIADVKNTPHAYVELVDGSVLRGSKIAFKVKDLTATTLSGLVVTVPIASIKTVQQDASDSGMITQWKLHLTTIGRPTHDILFFKKEGKLGYLVGTFYDASEEGDRIEFLSKEDQDKGIDVKAKPTLKNIYGMAFRRPAVQFAKELLCRVSDSQGSTLMAESTALKDGKLTVKTQCGATAELAPTLLAKLDYSKGKFTYLSDYNVAQMRVVEKPAVSGLYPFKRDLNLDGGPIFIETKGYQKGLSMHSYSDLTFELDGSYREFKATAGIDDNVGKTAPDVVTRVRVEADGKELLSLKLTRKDGSKPILLNVQDVQRLRIIVSSDEVFGMHSHVTLADALVTK